MDDVVDRVRRRLRHALGTARRAEPAPFTTAVNLTVLGLLMAGLF